MLSEKNNQIRKLYSIINDYKKREEASKEENHQASPAMHITLSNKNELNSSSNVLHEMKEEKIRLEGEIKVLNLKMDYLTKENSKLKKSTIY